MKQVLLATPSRSADPEHKSQSESLCVDEIFSPQFLGIFSI